ncbi:Putative mitochondrial protein, partial [Durusdinium trenchii]
MDSVLRGKLAEQMSRAENEALLAGMENTYQLLRQSGLMYTIQISPAFVGCHPQNRDGIGVDQQHVHSLVDKFQESGFASSAGRYMAVEVEPGNNTVKDFNEEMVAKSNGQLAPIKDTLKYASISGSHSNQALRLWHYACQHNGKPLSIDALRVDDAAYAECASSGVMWQVIDHAVVQAFPQFVGLCQAACNSVQQVSQVETEFQLMHRLRQHVGAKGELPPYADIAPSILRSHPPNPDVLPYVYKFMSRSGEASMMKNTESFVAAFGSVKNQLGASVWDALSLDTRHKNEDLVLWRQALLKTMMTCNDRVVSVGDIKRSLSNAQMLTKIIVFEKNLLTLKNEMPKFKLTEFQKIAGLGAFEVRCVMFALQKKPKDPDAQLTMPVESVAHAKTAARLMEKFAIGDLLVRSDGEGGRILAMTPLELKMQGDQGEFVLQADEVLNSSDWKKQSEPKPRVPVKDPDLWHSVLAATDVKARASIRLWEEGYKMTPKSDDLSLWAKPKGVVVTKDFGKGKIVLPALTNRIELLMTTDGKTPPSGSYLLCDEKVQG